MHSVTMGLLVQVVTAWNGMAIGAFAKASRILEHERPAAQRCFPIEGCSPSDYLAAATQVAGLDWHQHHAWLPFAAPQASCHAAEGPDDADVHVFTWTQLRACAVRPWPAT